MRIAIVGAGAVGGLLGALLARAGAQVSFLARGQTLLALRERGLSVQSETLGLLRIDSVAASEDARELAPADAVILATKAWQLEELAPRLAGLFDKGTVAVPLQNGVDASFVLARRLGSANVAGGLTYLFASIQSPGVIRHGGGPLRVAMGPLPESGATRARLEELAAALRAGGVDASVSPDIAAQLWEKLLFVGPLGAVGAASRATAGELRAAPKTRALLEAAMREVASVARAEGVIVAPGAVQEALRRVDALPAAATTSLHRDLLGGRRSELDELVGTVARRAHAHGVPVPVHRTLLAALEPLEQAARATNGARA